MARVKAKLTYDVVSQASDSDRVTRRWITKRCVKMRLQLWVDGEKVIHNGFLTRGPVTARYMGQLLNMGLALTLTKRKYFEHIGPDGKRLLDLGQWHYQRLPLKAIELLGATRIPTANGNISDHKAMYYWPVGTAGDLVNPLALDIPCPICNYTMLTSGPLRFTLRSVRRYPDGSHMHTESPLSINTSDGTVASYVTARDDLRHPDIMAEQYRGAAIGVMTAMLTVGLKAEDILADPELKMDEVTEFMDCARTHWLPG